MNGSTLVLVSSLGCDARIWAHFSPAVGQRTLHINLPGHGTGAPVPSAWSVRGFGELLARRLPDADRTTICGVGLGAAVAVEAVAAAPHMFSHLVLLSACRIMPGPPWTDRAEAALAATDMYHLADGILDRWLTERSQQGSPDLVAQLRQMIGDTSPKAYAQGCFATANLDLTVALARISVPTLVVAGSADEATPPTAADDLAAHLMVARRFDLSDSAHMIPAERPRELAKLVKEFTE